MTEAELIEEITTEITAGGVLPFLLGESEVKRAIKSSKRFFYNNHREATQRFGFVIQQSVFEECEFRSNKRLILPDNIISVDEVKEIKNHQSFYGMGISPDKALASQLSIFSINGTYDIVMRAAAESYYDLSKSYMLDKISYEFNVNDHSLVITGRTPKYDVFVNTWVQIPSDKLYEDHWFIRYATCQVKLSYARALLWTDFNLPGGIQLNAGDMLSQSESEIEKIEEKVKLLDPPDWFLLFN